MLRFEALAPRFMTGYQKTTSEASKINLATIAAGHREIHPIWPSPGQNKSSLGQRGNKKCL